MKGFDRLEFIKMGMKEVPVVKYVVAVGVVAVVVAIVLDLKQDPIMIVSGVIISIALAVLIVILRALVKRGQKFLTVLGYIMAVFVLGMFMWVIAYGAIKHFGLWEFRKEDKVTFIPQPTPSQTQIVQKPEPTPDAMKSPRPIPPGIKGTIPIPNTEAYDIVGHVIDGTYENVTVENSPVMGAEIVIRNRESGDEFKTTSDSWGKFYKKLLVGSYKITATHSVYNDESNTCIVKATKNIPCEIRFTHKKDNLAALGTIWGHIRDEQSQSIAGVKVTVKNTAPPNETLSDYSGISGEFRFQDVPHGEYSITFQHSKFKSITQACHTQKSLQCMVNVQLPKEEK